MTTFDLDIPAPNSREWLALLIGAAALVAGLVINDESWYVQALLTVGGGVLGVAGLAAVLNWIVGMALIRIAQASEILRQERLDRDLPYPAYAARQDELRMAMR